jgi:hypothetical protein
VKLPELAGLDAEPLSVLLLPHPQTDSRVKVKTETKIKVSIFFIVSPPIKCYKSIIT